MADRMYFRSYFFQICQTCFRIDIFDVDQSDVLYELEYASESLRIASQNIAKHQAALRQKITIDKHLRLVYSKGGKQ